jgi:hypothetical protein
MTHRNRTRGNGRTVADGACDGYPYACACGSFTGYNIFLLILATEVYTNHIYCDMEGSEGGRKEQSNI